MIARLQLQKSTFFFQLLPFCPGRAHTEEATSYSLSQAWKISSESSQLSHFHRQHLDARLSTDLPQYYCLGKTGPASHQEFQIADIRNKALHDTLHDTVD